MTDASFGGRLDRVFAGHGHLCVGIDPHVYLLREWGLSESAAGAREFGLRVVDAAAGSAGVVKPQVAFFERFGSAGFAALEDVIRAARGAGLLVIADAKRGDIGSSVDAYGAAWLEPGSPLECDALTVSPYLGVGALESVFRLAESAGKGVFVLAATSNPEAAALQRDGVAARVLDEVRAWNAARAAERALDGVPSTSSGTDAGSGTDNARNTGAAPASPETASSRRPPETSKAHETTIGSIGVVLGATLDLADFGIATTEPDGAPCTPVLAPGFGSQGAAVESVRDIYGSLARAAIVSESRSILIAGPDELGRVISRRARDVREAYA